MSGARGSSPIPRIDDALIGAVLDGKYRIARLLGTGAMGAVYYARHVKLDREAAVKVLHQDLLINPRMRERFAAEARIAGGLRHENLVGVIDMVELESGALAMVCEFAKGIALSDLRAREGRLSQERALEVLRGILRGLGAAHAASLIHRDLKPDNVMIEELSDGRWRPRIIDFGIALAHDQPRQTEIGTVVGTPIYMAPEQALAQEITPRSDLFALGVIAYDLLAGKTPFGLDGVDAALANLSRDMPAFAERVPGLAIDPVLEAIVRKLMAKRPTDRFASAAEVLEMLDLFEFDREVAGSLLGVDGGIALRPVPPLRERVQALRPPELAFASSSVRDSAGLGRRADPERGRDSFPGPETTQRLPRLPTNPPEIAIGRVRTRRTRTVSEPIAKLSREPEDD